MRSRSLLPGVLGRGRERTSHSRARSLSARPMCPGIIAADLLSSPAKWHHRNRGSPLEGGSCPNRIQRSPTTFHRGTRTAESCGSIRRTQYSLPPLYPIWTLPTSPRPSARPEPHGRPFAGITVTRAHPDPDGTPHLTPPPRPSRGPSRCCRAGPTSTDQVAGSCGRSCSDSLGP